MYKQPRTTQARMVLIRYLCHSRQSQEEQEEEDHLENQNQNQEARGNKMGHDGRASYASEAEEGAGE